MEEEWANEAVEDEEEGAAQPVDQTDDPLPEEDA